MFDNRFGGGDEVNPELSRFIAGLIGPVLAAIACSMLLNRDLAPEIAAEVTHSKGLILLSGVSLLVAGIALVQCHSTWTGWPAIITVMGWLSIFSGLVRVLFPAQLAGMAADLSNGTFNTIIALACLGLGAFLTYKAYT